MTDVIKKVRELLETGELMEQLAHIEHERWSGWMNHQFKNCIKRDDINGLLIPGALVARWLRQVDTPYVELTEAEKESDRREVRNTLACIKQALSLLSEAGDGWSGIDPHLLEFCHQMQRQLEANKGRGDWKEG